MPDKLANEDLPTTFRVTEREALRMTLERFCINETEFARSADIAPNALSEFKNGRRNIQTNTLAGILNQLTTEQYQYYLRMLAGADFVLRDANPLLSQALDSPEERRRALYALVGSFVSFCTREEQLALLGVIYRASRINRNLQEPGIKSSVSHSEVGVE
ncbi:MAG: hypothetical protein F6K00_33770 [Leptolyngbya sp. SIOISBB]|nr:hypothetical protein [Leptolyngbya sp. SIOISBB]